MGVSQIISYTWIVLRFPHDVLLCWNSDIRGVAVDGVEGEPVSLTEPVTEAIAAAFAAWLLDRKKPDSSTRLKVSVGNDSRISAQKLQVPVI